MLTDRLLCIGVWTPDGVTVGDSPVVLAANCGGESALNCPFAVRLNFFYKHHHSMKLHWLRVPERITFKLATLTFRCLHGTAPAYIALYQT